MSRSVLSKGVTKSNSLGIWSTEKSTTNHSTGVTLKSEEKKFIKPGSTITTIRYFGPEYTSTL